MSLDVYFRNDLQQIIAGTLYSSLNASVQSGVDTSYCLGVMAQARAMAIATGVKWKSVECLVAEGIEVEVLQLLLDNNIPLIGESV